jgi:hypothetical protein
MPMLADANRALAAVAALLLFTLNDVRMFQTLPRAPDAARDLTNQLTLRLMGAVEPVYVGLGDLVMRWGLAGLTFGLCMWALAETLPRRPLFGSPRKP